MRLVDVSTEPGEGEVTELAGIYRPYMREFLDFCFKYFDNVIIWTTVPTAVMADNKSMNHKVAVSVAFPTYLRNVRGKNQVVWFLAGQSNDKVNLMWW